ERWFEDTEVAIKADGTLLGFRTTALDDAGAWLRYEPLGGVIWAQVTPGMYRWRHIRLDFKQVVTNKAPVSPNRGYSRMQDLWFTERIIDIVAHEHGLDPVEVRRRNYIRTDEMLYETPNGCIYDSGDYAKMLDTALELIGYDELDSRRAGDDSYWNSHAGFAGTYASQFAVTGLGAVKGATDMLAEQMKKLASVVLGCPPEDIELAEGQARMKANPEAALPFMALGAIINANNAGL